MMQIEIPKPSSCSVFIVYGSSFGGFKSGNGSHASMDQPACVLPLGRLPFSVLRCKLLNLYVTHLQCYLQKFPIVQAQLILLHK